MFTNVTVHVCGHNKKSAFNYVCDDCDILQPREKRLFFHLKRRLCDVKQELFPANNCCEQNTRESSTSTDDQDSNCEAFSEHSGRGYEGSNESSMTDSVFESVQLESRGALTEQGNLNMDGYGTDATSEIAGGFQRLTYV